MKKKRLLFSLFILTFTIIIFNLLLFDSLNFSAVNSESEKEPEFFRVTRIIDGDTIKISNGKTIRLICVDTPEFGELRYSEATLYLESLILNKQVRLVKDTSEVDLYNRTLRYVYLEDIFVNKEIAEKGLGRAYPVYPDTALCSEILEAEKKAKSTRLGIWTEECD